MKYDIFIIFNICINEYITSTLKLDILKYISI